MMASPAKVSCTTPAYLDLIMVGSPCRLEENKKEITLQMRHALFEQHGTKTTPETPS
jgi:hypothetical protein